MASSNQQPAPLTNWTSILAVLGTGPTGLAISFLVMAVTTASTHFTTPQRVESWVDLVGWLYTEMVYLPVDKSLIQVLTGPTVE